VEIQYYQLIHKQKNMRLNYEMEFGDIWCDNMGSDVLWCDVVGWCAMWCHL